MLLAQQKRLPSRSIVMTGLLTFLVMMSQPHRSPSSVTLVHSIVSYNVFMTSSSPNFNIMVLVNHGFLISFASFISFINCVRILLLIQCYNNKISS